MIEWNLLELEFLPQNGAMLQQFAPEQCTFARAKAIFRIQIRQNDYVIEPFKRRDNLSKLFLSLKGLSPVAVAVDTKNHLRREWLDAIVHTPRAEVRRAARPN